MINNDLRRFYKTMYVLVSRFYFETFFDDIGPIGSSMALAIDVNETIDPAIWHDWLEAIKQVKGSENVPENITVEEGYEAAIKFFNFEADLWDSKNLAKFVETLTFEKWQEALVAVENGEAED